MPKFSVMLLQEASTVVDVEADTIDEAIDAAYNLAPGFLNISNRSWEESGDLRAYNVQDADGNEVWREGQEDR